MNLTDAWRRVRPRDHDVKLFGGGEERDLLDAHFANPIPQEVVEAWERLMYRGYTPTSFESVQEAMFRDFCGHIMESYIPDPFVDIVFDGPPSAESGRFVEVENAQGQSIRFGDWIERPDGYWALRITTCPQTSEPE